VGGLAGAEQRYGLTLLIADVDGQRRCAIRGEIAMNLAVGAKQLGLGNGGGGFRPVVANSVVVDRLLRDGDADVSRDQGDRYRQDEQPYRESTKEAQSGLPLSANDFAADLLSS